MNTSSKTDWVPLTVVCLVVFIVTFNIAVLPMTISSIGADLGIPATSVQAAILIYSLGMSILTILGGKLSGLYGTNRILRLGLGIFALAMITIAMATDTMMLLLGETLAALGAALLIPTLIAVIAQNYRGEQQVFAVGLMGAMGGIGGALALLLGGVIIGWVNWRAPFWLIALIAGLTYGLSLRLRTVKPIVKKQPLDLVGVLLSALSILLIVISVGQITKWGLFLAKAAAPFTVFGLSPLLLLLLIGVLILQAFFAWEAKLAATGQQPILSPLITDTPLERSALILTIFTLFLVGGTNFLLPTYLQLVLGQGALATALSLLPFSLALFIGALATKRLSQQLPVRSLVMLSFLTIAVGSLLLALVFSQTWDGLTLIIALILMGGGIGVNMTSTSTLLISASPPELSGEVGGLRGTAANLGTALGTALVGAVLISTLTTSAGNAVLKNSVLNQDFKQKLNPDSVTFLSNAQLEAITAKDNGLSEPERQELLRINGLVRTQALQRSSLFMAAVALLAWGFTYPLPNRILSGEITGAKKLGG